MVSHGRAIKEGSIGGVPFFPYKWIDLFVHARSSGSRPWRIGEGMSTRKIHFTHKVQRLGKLALSFTRKSCDYIGRDRGIGYDLTNSLDEILKRSRGCLARHPF